MEQSLLTLKGTVEDHLLGVAMKNSNLLLLRNSKIIIRSDHESLCNKVKILSGGGSGHEPAQAGFVGDGFLTASVSGEIFASPSSSEIFRAINEIGSDHEAGVLLIVLNYTGDRLNFGLAMERARSNNIKVEMCIVNDDCAIQDYVLSVGRRGLAGAVLISKIAGALADKGWILEDIASTINNLLQKRNIKTVGISVDNDKVELGKGIHGEPGAFFLKLNSSDYKSMINEMLKSLMQNFSTDHVNEIVVLVNNLGGYTPCELLTIRNEVLNQLTIDYKKDFSNTAVRVYNGMYLSSLNVTGFSITILVADKLIIECIDYKCYADAWNAHYVTLDKYSFDDVLAHDKSFDGQEDYKCYKVKLSEKGSKIVYRSLDYLSEALVSCEKQLNKIDSEIGDGDTGSTIARGASEILRLLQKKKLKTDNIEITLKQISEIAEQKMGGTSGALYSIFFLAAASYFRNSVDVDLSSWLSALQAGNEAIQKYGLSKAGDRTMLDPLIAVQKSLTNSIQNNMPNFKALELATEAAEMEAVNTINMPPHAGRAVYSSKSIQIQYPDSGAHAIGIWMRAICEAVRSLKSGSDYI